MKTSSTHNSRICVLEALEARIAPATLTLPSVPSVLSYTDVDGDLVKITASKGDLAGHATYSEVGAGHQLLLLDLTDKSFAGANVTFSVQRVAGGDGLAHVGHINAAGNDLGRVVVRGDLGEIDAGDNNLATPAIKFLSAFSMGALGTSSSVVTPATEAQQSALADLLGNGLLNVPGLLSDVLGQLTSLQDLAGLSDSAHRLLATLGADLDSLLATVTDGSGGPLQGGCLTSAAEQILGNLAHDLTKVGSLSLLDQTQLLLLSPLLSTLEAKVEVALGVTVSLGASPSPGFLGLPLPLPGLPSLPLGGLLGGVVGGIGGVVGGVLDGVLGGTLGTLPVALGGALEDLGGQVTSLLGHASLLSALPTTVQTLLGDLGPELTTILGGHSPLDAGVLRQLAGLQSEIASLTGLAGAHPGFLTDEVVSALGSLTGLVSETFKNIAGPSNSPAESAAVSSDILGNVGQLQIRGNVTNVFLNIQGNLNIAKIGGSLSGSDAANSGELHVGGNLNSLKLRGSLIGGDGLNSGSIQVGGKTGTLTVRGSVVGGSAAHTGAITLGGDAQSVRVSRDLAGHEGLFSGSITDSHGSINFLKIRGSVIGADVDSSAAISATDEIGTLIIRRGVWGDADHSVAISAGGKLTANGLHNYAFRDVQIGRNVTHANLLAGYSADLRAMDGSAQIRSVIVAGDWHASSLSAGVEDQGAAGFGDDDSHFITPRDSSVLSSIASVQIRGAITGTDEGLDHYGFVAGSIGSFMVGKARLNLHASAIDAVALAQATGDVTVREIQPAPAPVGAA